MSKLRGNRYDYAIVDEMMNENIKRVINGDAFRRHIVGESQIGKLQQTYITPKVTVVEPKRCYTDVMVENVQVTTAQYTANPFRTLNVKLNISHLSEDEQRTLSDLLMSGQLIEIIPSRRGSHSEPNKESVQTKESGLCEPDGDIAGTW